MSTQTLDLTDGDTARVVRTALALPTPRPVRPRQRLADMDLDPPNGPVPDSVIEYFEQALERGSARRRH